jgi:hypothetical protein
MRTASGNGKRINGTKHFEVAIGQSRVPEEASCEGSESFKWEWENRVVKRKEE